MSFVDAGAAVRWKRFGSNEKSRTFALPFEKRRAVSSSKDCRIGSIRSVSRKKSKIFPETLAGLKKMRTFAAPFEKRVLERGKWKVHWKDWLLYKKQVPRKNTIYREALIPYGIISVRTDWKHKHLYNEEFDPGSGWTLAAGLTHASRGAAWRLAITFDGDRRKGA